MGVRYTDHAERQIAERGLDKAWVEATIAGPDRIEPDPSHAARTRAYRVIPERDGRVLRVVYETDGADAVVVSAFLDRGATRRGRRKPIP